MNFRYHPQDIAAMLAKLTGNSEDADIVTSAKDALYDLHTICQNDLNKDSYRDLYRLLELAADAVL